MSRREPTPPTDPRSRESGRPTTAAKVTAKAAAAKPSTGPQLRDRLREVLERDRALAEAQQVFSDAESGTRVRPPEALRDARSPEPLDASEGISLQVWNSAPLDSLDDWLRDASEVEDDELDVPTGVTRIDGALLLEDDGSSAFHDGASQPQDAHFDDDVEAIEPAAHEFYDDAPVPQSEALLEPQRDEAAAIDQPVERPTLQFADWIAEELGDDDLEALSVPVVITPPPPPRKALPRAARPSAKTRAERLAREPSSAELALAITTDVPAEHDSYPPELPASSSDASMLESTSQGASLDARTSLDAPMSQGPSLEPPTAQGGTPQGSASHDDSPADEVRPAAREPIVTRTMARLLAGHGYRARALAIYDELLRKAPDDETLREEAAALRASAK